VGIVLEGRYPRLTQVVGLHLLIMNPGNTLRAITLNGNPEVRFVEKGSRTTYVSRLALSRRI
jgi:hypothetical protein